MLLPNLINLPSGNNGLFKIDPAPGTSYLIETNLAFIDQSRFLGSNYLLQRLGYTPPSNQKLLGDAFYTTQFVNSQIFAQTGQRYIDGTSTDLAQMQDLMNNAASEQGPLQLSVGISLSSAQVAALTSDIVWPVLETVDGQQVLVPVLFLSQATLNGLSSSPANITAGNNLDITATGAITNAGKISAGNNLTLTAGADITNNGGMIQAGNNVSLTAVGDITSNSVVGGSTSNSNFIRQYVQASADITAGGSVSLTSGGDITALGSNINATNGNIAIAAGNDVNIGSIALENKTVSVAKHYYSMGDSITNVGSTVTAGSGLTINAGNDATISGSNVTSVGNIVLSAANDLTIAAVQNTSQTSSQSTRSSLFSSTKTFSSTYNLTNIASNITSTGGSVTLNAGTYINDLASNISAATSANLTAGNNINIISQNNISQSQQTSKTSGFAGGLAMGALGIGGLSAFGLTGTNGKFIKAGSNNEVTTVVSPTITAGTDISSTSGNNTTIVAGQLNAGGNVNINSSGTTTIASANNSNFTQNTSSSSSLMWQSQSNVGNSNSTVQNTTINAGGAVNINAAGGVTADVTNLGTVQQSIAILSKQPGLGYLANLQNNPNVNFNVVNNSVQNWNYKSQGLTQAGAAIIAIAVTAATMGAGTGAVLAGDAASVATGTTVSVASATVAGAASNAAFAALASEAAVDLANNKGDIGKTLQDLGNSQTVKNIALAAVVAGATYGIANMAGLNNAVNPNTLMPTSTADFAQRLEYAEIQAGVGDVASNIINGTNIVSGLGTRLQSGVALATGAWASGVTADQMAGSQGGVINTILQAGVGCAAGAAGGGACGAGAVGGAVGSFVGANGVGDVGSKIAGGTAELLVGGNAKEINLAADTAQSQAGVVAYSIANVKTAPALVAQLQNGANQAGEALSIPDHLVADVIPLPSNNGGLITKLATIASGETQYLTVKNGSIQNSQTINDIQNNQSSIVADNGILLVTKNGIMNSPEEAVNNGMQQTGQQDFTIAYTPNHGLVPDLIEVGWNKLFGTVAPTGNVQQNIQFDAIATQNNQTVDFFPHSAGVENMSLELQLSPKGSFSNANIQFSGGPVNTSTLQNASKYANVNSYVIQNNYGDAVPNLAGGNTNGVGQTTWNIINIPTLFVPALSQHHYTLNPSFNFGGNPNSTNNQ